MFGADLKCLAICWISPQTINTPPYISIYNTRALFNIKDHHMYKSYMTYFINSWKWWHDCYTIIGFLISTTWSLRERKGWWWHTQCGKLRDAVKTTVLILLVWGNFMAPPGSRLITHGVCNLVHYHSST